MAGSMTIGNPAGKPQTARLRRFQRQQRMIEAAEPHADDQHHRQVQPRAGYRRRSAGPPSGTSKPPTPSTTTTSARRGEVGVIACNHRHANRHPASRAAICGAIGGAKQ